MTRIVGRVAPAQREIVWVHGPRNAARRCAAVFVAGAEVNGMAPGVCCHEDESVAETLVEARLKRVIARYTAAALRADRRKDVSGCVQRMVRIVDVLMSPIIDTCWVGGALGRTGRGDRIPFVHQFQVTPLRAYVGELKDHGSRQLALDIQIEVHRVRVGEIRIDDVDDERVVPREIHGLARGGGSEGERVGNHSCQKRCPHRDSQN